MFNKIYTVYCDCAFTYCACVLIFFNDIYDTNIVRVPTRTGKPGKPGKMGRHFPVREKSGDFEQTGKVREKSHKILENSGNLR